MKASIGCLFELVRGEEELTSAFLCFLIVDIQNVHGSVSDICKEISSLEISKVVYNSRISLWVKATSHKAEMIFFAVETVMDFLWIHGSEIKEKLFVPICSRIQKSITVSTAKNIISALWDVAFTHRDIRLL